MKKSKNKFLKASVWLVGLLLVSASCMGTTRKVSSDAHYCADNYGGEGTHVSATYTVEYEYAVEYTDYHGGTAPSLNSNGAGTSNACAANAGLNVMAYYDRYYPNLIPDYEPGVTVGSIYYYFPNSNNSSLRNTHTTLYNYMRVNQDAPGTSEEDFKNGLSQYVSEQGYSASYTSIRANSTSVNLFRVQQMVKNHQVAVLFLSGYNFIYGFDVTDTSRTVYMTTSTAGHVMMVYGYITVDYYANGRIFLSETFLEVSSCFGTSDEGYIKLNHYGTLDDALIVTIS